MLEKFVVLHIFRELTWKKFATHKLTMQAPQSMIVEEDFLNDFLFEGSPSSNASTDVHTPPEAQQQFLPADWTSNYTYPMYVDPNLLVAAQHQQQHLIPNAVVSSPDYSSTTSSPIDHQSTKKTKRSKTSSDDEPPSKKRKRAADEVAVDNAMLQELCQKKNSILSEDEKKMKRVLRNRQSAAKSREKKRVETELLKDVTSTMQQRIDELEAKVYVTFASNIFFISKQLEQRNAYLEQVAQMQPQAIVMNESDDAGPILELSSREYGRPIATPALFVIVFCVGLFFISSSLMFGAQTQTRQNGHYIPKSFTPSQNNPIQSTLSTTPVTSSTTEQTTTQASPASRQILSTSQSRADSSRSNTSYEKCNWKQDHDDSTTPIVNDEDVKLSTRVDSPLMINLNDLDKSAIFYPRAMERHFAFKKSETPLHTPKNASADTTIEAEKNESMPTTSGSTLNSNASGELVISSNGNDIKAKDYEIAYLLQQQDEKTGKKSLLILCPFSYPLLPNDPSSQQQQQETLDLTVLIPDSRTVKLSEGNEFVEVRRVAKITAENMKFHEAYVAFPKANYVK